MIGERTELGRLARTALAVAVVLAIGFATASIAVTCRYASGVTAATAAAVWANAATVSFPFVGAVIVLRGGNRRVGWTLVGLGVATTLDAATVAYADAFVAGHDLPLGRWACWTDEWVWVFLIVGTWLLLALFPDGRPCGRAGRAFVGYALAAGMLVLTTRPFHSGQLVDYPAVATPLPPVPGLTAWADLVSPGLLGPVLFAGFALAFATLVHRYVRSDAVRRTQLRWLAWAFGLTLVFVLAQQLPVVRPVVSIATQAMIPLLPVAVGLAMFRERLYDVDRLISRTVAWGLLTAALAAVYAGVVTLVSTVVPVRFGSFGVAAATLTVAAVSGPVRRAVQHLVDRRFDRAQVSHRRAIADFARVARDDVDVDQVERDLLGVVGWTLAPSAVSLWRVPVLAVANGERAAPAALRLSAR